LRKSLTRVCGTARRCVSRYSESWIRALGGTMDRRERVERLPVWRRWEARRLVLRELYWLNLAFTSLSIPAISWGHSSVSWRWKGKQDGEEEEEGKACLHLL
jgi:hypothetical protein